MEGGCINIWFEKPLSVKERDLVEKYSTYINSFSAGYLLRFKDLKIRSKSQKEQIQAAIGYIPTFEIYICSFVDNLFLSAEAILKELGGFLSISFQITLQELIDTNGVFYNIKNTSVNYYLIDWKVTSKIFNSTYDENIKELFSFKRFASSAFPF